MTRRKKQSAAGIPAEPRAASPGFGPAPARTFAALLAILGIVPLANLLSDLTPEPTWNAAAVHWAALTLITLTLAIGFAWVLGARVDRWSEAIVDALTAPPPWLFALTCAVIAFALAAATSWFAFARQWVSADEAVAIWHGRVILSGHLWVPADPDPVFFSGFDVPAAGARWYSPVPIGGPMLMALGDLLHMQWLLGPVITGVGVAAFYAFLARAYDDRTARLSTLVLIYAGPLVLMGATRMTHVPALACVMIALAALARWAHATTPRVAYGSAAVIGAALGVAFSVRPYDAVIAAGVIGLFQLTALRRAPARARSLVVQLAVGLVPVLATLAANRAMTGHALQFGYAALNGTEHDPGFHMSPYGYEHTVTRGIMLASSYLIRANESLLFWPIPAMLVIVAGLLAMRRTTRWDLLVFAMITAFVAAYGAYWFDGDLFGPRFLYPVVPLLVFLAARAPAEVGARLHGWGRRATLLVVPLCLGYAWLVPNARFGLVRRVIQQRTFAPSARIDVDRVIASAPHTPALVFVPTGWRDRLLARLAALGVPQGDAIQLHDFADACDLEHAIGTEEAAPASAAAHLGHIAEATRDVQPAPLRAELGTDGSIRLRDVSHLPADCALEIAADSVGYINFATVMPYDRFDAAGRLAGEVLFARDLGDERNDQLYQRFGDRTWYRLRRSTRDATLAYLVPYAGHWLPAKDTASASSR